MLWKNLQSDIANLPALARIDWESIDRITEDIEDPYSSLVMLANVPNLLKKRDPQAFDALVKILNRIVKRLEQGDLNYPQFDDLYLPVEIFMSCYDGDIVESWRPVIRKAVEQLYQR